MRLLRLAAVLRAGRRVTRRSARGRDGDGGDGDESDGREAEQDLLHGCCHSYRKLPVPNTCAEAIRSANSELSF